MVVQNISNLCYNVFKQREQQEVSQMKIYYADIRDVDDADALYPPTSQSRGSALGASLLAEAYRDFCGSARAPLPQIKRLIGGKPVFAKEPELHFSISHSRTHVLCALSGSPVGADTLDHREVSQRVIERLATEDERKYFTFYQLWCLRESYFKLTGEGDLRSIRLTKENGRITAPNPETFCRVYNDIPYSTVAVCSMKNCFPEKLIEVPVEKLLRKKSKLLP